MTQALDETEIFIKNHLDALLKPIVGMNHGRNAPLIKANDTGLCEHSSQRPVQYKTS